MDEAPPSLREQLMNDEPQYDENGKEIPEGYLFGKIPYYKNPYADFPLWKLLLLAAPMAIGLALYRHYGG